MASNATCTCICIVWLLHCRVEVSYSVDIVFHTPGKFSSAIRSSQPLMVHQRLQAPPMTVDQTAVGGRLGGWVVTWLSVGWLE